MVLDCLLVVCLVMLGGIYGVFWQESHRNRIPVRRHHVAPVRERGTRFLLSSGLVGLAGCDGKSTRR